MHKEEIRRLIGKVEQRGFTLVPLNLHFKGGRVKARSPWPRARPARQARHRKEARLGAREGPRLSMKACTPSSADSSIMLQAMVWPASS
jgi:SsrA-binding protein